ncbi:NusA-like transcription termination signal-binding factor [Nanoarchaeota archaeon]
MKIKYDLEIMKYMALFEKITKSKLKDCFFDENSNRLVFVVEKFQLMKALGTNSQNVQKLENLLNKKLKFVQFHDDLNMFVKNWIHPLKAENIEVDEENNVVTISSSDIQTKGLLIGKKAQNLRNSEKVIQRYFSNLKEIKVI